MRCGPRAEIWKRIAEVGHVIKNKKVKVITSQMFLTNLLNSLP